MAPAGWGRLVAALLAGAVVGGAVVWLVAVPRPGEERESLHVRATATPSSRASGASGAIDASRWPNAKTTGVGDIQLIPNPVLRVTTPGEVIDGYEVHGDISVEADDVVIRRTRVVSDSHQGWGIIQRQGVGGLVIEDSEIVSTPGHKIDQAVLNFGGMLTVRRTNISGTADGVVTSHGLIEGNYIHDPSPGKDDHVDLIQAGSGPAAGLKLIIRNNTLFNQQEQTSAVGLFQDFGAPHDVLIEGNLLGGGGYSLYAGRGADDKHATSNIKVIKNVWTRQIFPKGGRWGPVNAWESAGRGNEWRDNVWLDTGRPVEP
ncbi:hypothetical protein [Microbispora sp. H10670]|uniref:hypothetical protein n=1 Tax=Microbispora sp. H10670 TaxID=2729108 RepID=UPI00160371C1|nr:hypothetical protein [Microbispora sp. H10670]